MLAEQGIDSKVVLIGSGKLSIGCIQAQRCHTGHCPTGVATQNAWLMRGLDPTYKAARFANYVVTLRKEILQLSHACGAPHPSLVTLDSFDILDPGMGARSAHRVFGYDPSFNVKSPAERAVIEGLMAHGPRAVASV